MYTIVHIYARNTYNPKYRYIKVYLILDINLYFYLLLSNDSTSLFGKNLFFYFKKILFIIVFIDHLLSNYYPFTLISGPIYSGWHFRGHVVDDL